MKQLIPSMLFLAFLFACETPGPCGRCEVIDGGGNSIWSSDNCDDDYENSQTICENFARENEGTCHCQDRETDEVDWEEEEPTWEDLEEAEDDNTDIWEPEDC